MTITKTMARRSQIRRRYRSVTGAANFRAILGNASGAVSVPGEPHLYYIRTATGLNSDGTTQYGNDTTVLSGIYKDSEEAGTPVIVGMGYDGQLAILGADRVGLVELDINPRSTNPNSPYDKFVNLADAVIGLVKPIGTAQTDSMKVVAFPLVYQDDTGVLKIFAGAQLDLTGDIPAANGDGDNMQLISGVFVNSSNTLVSVTSTAKLVGDTLSWASDVVEIIATARASYPRAIPLRYFKLTTGQTNLTEAEEFDDGRQWVNMAIRNNNYAATAAPAAATDDVTLGYEVGSRVYDVTNDNWYVCLDNSDGAAVWQKPLITTPAAAAQNAIVPTTDVVPLTITGHASATANLQNWNGGVSGAISISPTADVTTTGAISSGTLTQSAVGPTDDLDVSGVNTVFLDCSSNAVTIGAFVGGVDGQVLYLARLCASANAITLEHNEGTANQNIFLHAGADEALTTEYGGWVLICNGTSWFDTSHSKHV